MSAGRPAAVSVTRPDRARHRSSLSVVERPPGPARAEGLATLGRVCADVGTELLDILVAPVGLEVMAAGVSLHDPIDAASASFVGGEVVLAIGVTGDDHATRELLRTAGAANACAIVCRHRRPPSVETLGVAEEAGIALLAAKPAVSWKELYDVLQSAIALDEPELAARGTGSGLDDLFALADATAAVADGAVTIEDTAGRVLAYSRAGQEVDATRTATILERQVPEHWMRELRRHGILERLMRSEGAILVEVPNVEPRRTIAIRAGGHVVGVIWLAGGNCARSAEVDLALREAARLAALHLMRQRVTSDLERRVRGGMLQTLLRGNGVAANTLERLGLPTGGGYVVLAVAFAADAAAGPRAHQRLVDLIVLHLQAYHLKVAATALDGRVYALVAVADEDEREALMITLQDCVNRAHRALAVDLRVGIGERVSDGEAIAEARASADRCVELGRAPNRLVAYEDVHDDVLLDDVRGFLAHHPCPLSRELRVLLELDRRHDKNYVATLRAFLAALGEAGVAAERLQIHVNTFRYRMRRIVEITGLDLADADTRFALELQLRALS
jgi:sugar diacid utilization regulator